MTLIKGWSKKPQPVNNMVKKGYTKAHIANSKKKKFKDAKAPAQLGQQNNDNNAKSMEKKS